MEGPRSKVQGPRAKGQGPRAKGRRAFSWRVWGVCAMMVGALVPLPGNYLFFLDGTPSAPLPGRPVQVTAGCSRYNARVFLQDRYFDGHYCRPVALCCTAEPRGDIIVVPGRFYLEITAGSAQDLPSGRHFACHRYDTSGRPHSPQLRGFDGDWLCWHWAIPPTTSRGRNAVTLVSTSFSPYDCRICIKPVDGARRLFLRDEHTTRELDMCDEQDKNAKNAKNAKNDKNDKNDTNDTHDKRGKKINVDEVGEKARVSLVMLSPINGLLFARLQGSRDVSIMTRARHTAVLGETKISDGVVVELAWTHALSSGSLRQSWCGTSPM
jgi:hypothetical protein